MKDADYRKIEQLLEEPKTILISTHRSPDGDAIGSSLGLAGVLVQFGHEVSVVVPDEYPHFLKWMEGTERIQVFEQDAKKARQLAEEAEVIFSLDYNALHRIGDFGESIAQANAIKIMIDHHQQPDEFPDFMLSDNNASSTAELVYVFLQKLGWTSKVNKGIAEALYTGILTDTGSFRFNSTSANTHRITAELMDTGLQVDEVYNQIFDTNRLERLRLMGYTLSEKLKVIPGKPVAYLSLSNEELDRFNFERGDTEGLVNFGLSIEGIKFAAFFRESKESDYIRISLRSKEDVNVNEFARAHFNGGGHINAAGGRSDLSLKQTIEKFETIVTSIEF